MAILYVHKCDWCGTESKPSDREAPPHDWAAIPVPTGYKFACKPECTHALMLKHHPYKGKESYKDLFDKFNPPFNPWNPLPTVTFNAHIHEENANCKSISQLMDNIKAIPLTY